MLGIEIGAWGLAIISAILQIIIFPLANLYALSWIALAPLLIALLRARRPPTLAASHRMIAYKYWVTSCCRGG